MKALGIVFAVILVTAGMSGLVWIIQGNDFFMFQFFAPKYEQVRRNTFEQSRAFNEGMIRDLENLKMQYEASDDTGKAALRDVIIHRFSVYPEDQMPPNLRSFYVQLTRPQ